MTGPLDRIARQQGDGLLLRVRLQPGASRTGLVSLLDDEVRLRVCDRAADGAANAALITLLAELLGVSQGHVAIASGRRPRSKLVRVRTDNPVELQERLEALLSTLPRG